MLRQARHWSSSVMLSNSRTENDIPEGGGGERGGKREEVRSVRWEEEGEKDKCLAVITRQVRYDLYNKILVQETRALPQNRPRTTLAYVVQYTISACAQALLLCSARKPENYTAREERRTSLLLGRLSVHVVARELEEEGCP